MYTIISGIINYSFSRKTALHIKHFFLKLGLKQSSHIYAFISKHGTVKGFRGRTHWEGTASTCAYFTFQSQVQPVHTRVSGALVFLAYILHNKSYCYLKPLEGSKDGLKTFNCLWHSLCNTSSLEVSLIYVYVVSGIVLSINRHLYEQKSKTSKD